MRFLVLVFALFPMVLSANTLRVIDGDTFVLDGQVIRVHGIDAPERGQRCRSGAGRWDCGAAATDYLLSLLSEHPVRCDALGEDGYDRKIARCYAGSIDVGGALVEQGLAWAFVRYSNDYVAAERRAAHRARGIWGAQNETPWDFRTRRWADAAQDAPDGCPIKGNISSNGNIYHAPWSRWYGRTRINLSKGERWFCNEAEAIAAGWRAPYVN